MCLPKKENSLLIAFKKKCNRAQCGLFLYTELHGSQTKWFVATGWHEGRNLQPTPAPRYQYPRKGTSPWKAAGARRQAALLGTQLCPASCQRTLSKASRIPSLHSDQGCLLPLPQAKEPNRCADESRIFTTASLESCLPIPGTAARTPGQSLQNARSGSGALGCGAPPGPAAQAQGNTSRQGNYHLSTWRGKSSTK